MEIYILLILVLICAFVAIESREAGTSVLALGATGIAICIFAAAANAPIVSLVQLSIEIVLLAMLINMIGADKMISKEKGNNLFHQIILFVFIIFILFISLQGLKTLPEVGNSVFKQAEATRQYDMLALIACIFSAAVGVTAILRLKGKKSYDEKE